MANRRCYLGVAAHLRGCRIDPFESLHSSQAYRLQLEVLEDEYRRLAMAIGAVASVTPLGNSQVDLKDAAAVIRGAQEHVWSSLPYVIAAQGGKTPIEQEREEAVARYHDMYRRMMKDAVNAGPAPVVAIKPVKADKHAQSQ